MWPLCKNIISKGHATLVMTLIRVETRMVVRSWVLQSLAPMTIGAMEVVSVESCLPLPFDDLWASRTPGLLLLLDVYVVSCIDALTMLLFPLSYLFNNSSYMTYRLEDLMSWVSLLRSIRSILYLVWFIIYLYIWIIAILT